MKLTDLNEKLTAYLLGELEGDEKQEVEDILKNDEIAKQTFEELSGAVDLASTALGDAETSDLNLSDTQRETIRQNALTPATSSEPTEAEPSEPDESSGLLDMRALQAAISSTDDESDEEPIDDLIAVGSSMSPVLAPLQPTGGQKLKVGIIAGGVALAATITVVLALTLGGGDEETKDAQLAALEAKIAQMSSAGASESEMAAAKEKLEEAKGEEEPNADETDTKAEEDTGTAIADAEVASKPKGKPRGKGKPSSSSSGSSSSGSSSSSSSSSGSSSSSSTPKPSSSKGKSELDDLLGGSAPKPKPKPTTSSSSSGGGGGDVKPSLDRADVQKGMNGVASKVKRCGAGNSGTITVKAVIGGTGRVISAVSTGNFAGTPAGNCAARAVRGARFPKSKKNLTVRYPFKL